MIQKWIKKAQQREKKIAARKPKMANFLVRNGKLPSKANSLEVEAQYTCE